MDNGQFLKHAIGMFLIKAICSPFSIINSLCIPILNY